MTSLCGRTLNLARAESVECGYNEMCHAGCLIIALYLGVGVHSANGIAPWFQRSSAIMCNVKARPDSWWGMGGASI